MEPTTPTGPAATPPAATGPRRPPQPGPRRGGPSSERTADARGPRRRRRTARREPPTRACAAATSPSSPVPSGAAATRRPSRARGAGPAARPASPTPATATPRARRRPAARPRRPRRRPGARAGTATGGRRPGRPPGAAPSTRARPARRASTRRRGPGRRRARRGMRVVGDRAVGAGLRRERHRLGRPVGLDRHHRPARWATARSATPADGATDILLVGVDSRTDAQGNPLPADVLRSLGAGAADGVVNTDTMMLVRIPNDGGRAVAFSIPRDSYVPIPGHSAAQDQFRVPGREGPGGGPAGGRGRRHRQPRGRTSAPPRPAAGRWCARRRSSPGSTSTTTPRSTSWASTPDQRRSAAWTCASRRRRRRPLRRPLPRRPAHGLRARRAGLRPSAPRPAAGRPRPRPAPAGVPRRLSRKVLSAGTLADPVTLTRLLDAVKQSVVLDGGWDLLRFAQQMQGVSGGLGRFMTIPNQGTETTSRPARCSWSTRWRCSASSPMPSARTGRADDDAPAPGTVPVDVRNASGTNGAAGARGQRAHRPGLDAQRRRQRRGLRARLHGALRAGGGGRCGGGRAKLGGLPTAPTRRCRPAPCACCWPRTTRDPARGLLLERDRGRPAPPGGRPRTWPRPRRPRPRRRPRRSPPTAWPASTEHRRPPHPRARPDGAARAGSRPDDRHRRPPGAPARRRRRRPPACHLLRRRHRRTDRALRPTLANWVAKTANLLRDECDVEPGHDRRRAAARRTGRPPRRCWGRGGAGPGRRRPGGRRRSPGRREDDAGAGRRGGGGRAWVLARRVRPRARHALPAGGVDYASEVRVHGDHFDPLAPGARRRARPRPASTSPGWWPPRGTRAAALGLGRRPRALHAGLGGDVGRAGRRPARRAGRRRVAGARAPPRGRPGAPRGHREGHPRPRRAVRVCEHRPGHDTDHPGLVRGALELERTERGLLPHRLPAWARAQAPTPNSRWRSPSRPAYGSCSAPGRPSSSWTPCRPSASTSVRRRVRTACTTCASTAGSSTRASARR